MPFEAIEREIGDAYLRLATSAGAVRYRQRHYLDGQTAGTLFGTVTALTAALRVVGPDGVSYGFSLGDWPIMVYT